MAADYYEAVRSFDHARLAPLPTYQVLRQALSDFGNEVEGISLEEFLRAVGEMALTAPFGDCCDTCRRDPNSDTYALVTAWPHAGEVKDGWMRGAYRCHQCGNRWGCGYATGMPDRR